MERKQKKSKKNHTTLNLIYFYLLISKQANMRRFRLLTFKNLFKKK